MSADQTTLRRLEIEWPAGASAVREAVPPAAVCAVTGEPVRLPAGKPDRWLHGWALRGIMSDHRGRDDTPVPGALRPGTLRLNLDGRRLDPGVDYLADEHWGVLTRLRELDGPVRADYAHAMLRVDSLFRGRHGEALLATGTSHLSNPFPPPAPAGAWRVANVYVPYTGPPLVFPVRPPAPVQTRPQRRRLPRTAALLAGGRPIRVTCWGDSVTAGASASTPATAYPQLLAGLFAAAGHTATVSTVATPGTNLRQWLGWEGTHLTADWSAVRDSRPDLLVVEFVNDAELPADVWEAAYRELVARTADLRCDLLLTTPHFTRLDWMGNRTLADPDRRPYVAFLRRFAESNGIALAEVSRAWEQLLVEGIPYVTLLRNGINHPDDRGHRIYAREVAAAIGLAEPITMAGTRHGPPDSG